jgi:hypothetical protein
MSCAIVNHASPCNRAGRPADFGAIAEQEGRINMKGPPPRGIGVTVMTMDRDETPDFHDDPTCAFDPLVQVRAYWEGLHEDGMIPLRSQISPRGIETALSSTFLIERVAPGMARFRIAGMDLSDIMGMDSRGMPISAFFTTEARPDLAKHLEQVFAAPAMLSMDLSALPELGRPTLTARLLALPLRDEKGRTGLALGCIALSGGIGRSPRRFDIGRATVTPLFAPKPRLPIASANARRFTPQVVASSAPRVFAETAARFDSTGSRKPHLRLVE